ncbi:MoaD family protein [bacterium]|nr:MoaD family protein [bacterium]
MRINVRVFSRLREVAGVGEISLELPEGSTVADLVSATLARHGELQVHEPSMLTAVNEEWAPRSRVLSHGDEVALMPPVSGG